MPKSQSALANVIQAINSKQSFPAVSIVNNDPDLAAIISKLVTSRVPKKQNLKNTNSYYELNDASFKEMSEAISNNVDDANNALQLFPDLKLAAQILISAILAPKDMVSTDVIYTAPDSPVCSELTTLLLKELKNQLEITYSLRDKLPQMLKEMLFESGSYISAVIPESSVDQLINGPKKITLESLESIMTKNAEIRSLQILGPSFQIRETSEKRLKPEAFSRSFLESNLPNNALSSKIAIENDTPSIKENPNFFVEVTDNHQILKFPIFIKANSKKAIRHLLSQKNVATETLSSELLEKMIYKRQAPSSMPLVNIPNIDDSERLSVGRPLLLKLPSEAVVPVCVPGNKREHIGYFVIIDEEGNPLSRASNKQYLQKLEYRMGKAGNDISSFLLAKAKKNIVGEDVLKLSIPDATKIYASIIESDLIERLRNGIYGRRVEVSGSNELYRIMLARTFANQFTRMVYMPAELVTYFALEWHESGVGKSLLDDLKILTSLRGILLFSKVMALTKNSIALTHVDMTLDPNDPDPHRTIEIALHEITKTRQQYFPLGINSPADLLDWVQKAGLEVTFQGHPGIPNTKLDFETKTMQHTVPDSDLDELLRKQTFMAMSLSPETVDAGAQAEFATSVVANSLLLSKRVTVIQNEFTPQLTGHAKNISRNDQAIKDALIKIISENRGLVARKLSDEDNQKLKKDEKAYFEYIYDRFIDTLVLSLPKPDVTTIRTQKEAYEQYKETLELTLESWISSEFMTDEFIGALGTNVDAIRSMFKAYFLRKWQAENGFMPELNDMITPDDTGKPTIDLYEIMKQHNEGIMLSAVKLIQSLKPIKTATDADLELLNVEPGEKNTSDDIGSSSGSTDDFGSDFDLSGEETEKSGEPENTNKTKEENTDEPIEPIE